MPSLATAHNGSVPWPEPGQGTVAGPAAVDLRGDRTALVYVEGVGKVFRRHGRKVKALTDVNLTVNEGEFVCLLGPSGCGKSTLLNIVAGILPYDEGSVVVDGKVVSGPAPTGACFSKAPCFSRG